MLIGIETNLAFIISRVLSLKIPCFLSSDRLREDAEMSTFYKTFGYIFHMEVDLYNAGNILFCDELQLKTTNGLSPVSRIAGHFWRFGYVEDVGTSAKFNIITGFVQLSPSKVVVADNSNHCLRIVDRETNRTAPLVGNCTIHGYEDGTQALFNYPWSVFKDIKDPTHILVSEHGNQVVRSINTNTLTVSTLFSFGPSIFWGIAQDPKTGDLYVTYRHSYQIDKYDYLAKEIKAVFQPATNHNEATEPPSLNTAFFEYPIEMTFLLKNMIIGAERKKHRLRVLDLETNTTTTICSGTKGREDGNLTHCELHNPHSVLMVNDSLFVGEATGGIRLVKCKSTSMAWKKKLIDLMEYKIKQML